MITGIFGTDDLRIRVMYLDQKGVLLEREDSTERMDTAGCDGVTKFLRRICQRLAQISCAAARTATVKPKNGPKSCVAGMLVMNKPGMEV